MEEFLRSYLHAGPLLVLSGIFLLLNVGATLTRRSRIPLLGAAFGVTACLMHPDLRPYFWLPIVLDLGTLEMIFTLPATIRREKRYGIRQRLAEFAFDEPTRRISLELFASGACRMKFQFKRAAGETGLITAEQVGTWKVGGNKRGRWLNLTISEGDPGHYAFATSTDPVQLLCQRENHPLPVREPAARLSGCTLELISGSLPKITPPSAK